MKQTLMIFKDINLGRRIYNKLKNDIDNLQLFKLQFEVNGHIEEYRLVRNV